MARLRVTEVLKSSELLILAVERLDTGAIRRGSGAFFSASIRPVALVTCDGRRLLAYDMESNSVELDRLCNDNPGLDGMLETAIGRWSP